MSQSFNSEKYDLILARMNEQVGLHGTISFGMSPLESGENSVRQVNLVVVLTMNCSTHQMLLKSAPTI